MFVFDLLVFVALNVVVAWGSFVLGRDFVSGVTFYFAQILVTMTFWGIVGMLSYEWVALSLAVLNLLLIFWSRLKKSKKSKVRKGWDFLEKLWDRLVERIADFEKPSKVMWMLVILAPFVVLRLTQSLVSPPLEYDAITYHLPMVGKWIASGSLWEVYLPPLTQFSGYYPGNFDLFFGWLVLPFGRDWLLNLVNFAVLGFLSYTIFKLLLNLKVSRKIASLMAVIPLFMPAFLEQMGAIFVDAFFALAFVLALFQLSVIYKEKEMTWRQSLLFGLALGMFMGGKYLGLAYGGVLAVAFVFLTARKRNFWRHFLRAALGVLLTGSFFYIRNYLLTGSIIPQFEVVLGTSLVENLWQGGLIWNFLYGYLAMLGWPIVLVEVGLLGAIILGWKDRKKRGFMWGTVLLSIVYFVIYAIAPFTYSEMMASFRYLTPFALIGVIVLGKLLEEVGEKRWSMLSGLILATIVASYIMFLGGDILKAQIELSIIGEVWILLAAVAAAVLLCGGFLMEIVKKWRAGLISVLSVLVFAIIAWAIQLKPDFVEWSYRARYNESSPFYYVIQGELAINRDFPEESVGVANTDIVYPLMQNFEREVIPLTGNLESEEANTYLRELGVEVILNATENGTAEILLVNSE